MKATSQPGWKVTVSSCRRMSSNVTTCEETYEMTKRQLDDIQWQASFLKHETPSTKMAAERADLSLFFVQLFIWHKCKFRILKDC